MREINAREDKCEGHFILLSIIRSSRIYGLLTKREVKMAGYWPSSFFVCLWTETNRDEVEVHKHAKKERGQYSAILTEQAWSIKDLLYDLKHQKMIFDLARPSEKSRAGKIAPSCPLR